MTALQEHILTVLGECPHEYIDLVRVSAEIGERSKQSWGLLQVTQELCEMEDFGWIQFSLDQHHVRLAGGRA